MSLPRIAGWLGVGLAAAACAGVLALQFQIGLNSDKQVLLAQTLRWLEGRSLYTSLMMPSPPMIFVLYAPIAGAWLALGLPIALGFDLFVCALLAASLLLCQRILASVPAPRDPLARAAILVAIAAGLVILPLRDDAFGDRDHLFAALAVPYLLLQSPTGATSALGRPARAAIGALAAAAFAIRPYFLAIWGAQQLYWMLRERSAWRVLRRFETQVAAAAFGVQALATLAFTPEYLRTVAPMAWASYPAISPPARHRWETLASAWTWLLAPPLTFAAALLARGPRPVTRDAAYLLFLCVGASLSSFAGGWHYAWYPLYLSAFAFAACAIAGLFAAARELWPAARGRAAACGLAGAFLLVLPVATRLFEPARERGASDLSYQRRTGWPQGRQRAPLAVDAFLERHLGGAPPTSFLLLGNGIWDSRLSGFDPSRTSVARYYALWPLPALVAARGEPQREAQTRWIERALLDGVTQDLREQRPDLVIVERSLWMWGLPRSFDVLGYFQRDPDFARAFQDYTLVDRIDVCGQWPNLCAFDVHRRKSLTP